MPRSQNAQKCSEGNTKPQSNNRVRWYPSFTAFTETAPTWNETKMNYLCYGLETCPTTGKQHYQGCVYFKDKVSLKTAQKLLNIGTSHMENAQKSKNQDDCINYCKKEGSFVEYGTPPSQGKRNDLESIKDDIVEGKTTADDIALDNPVVYHQYGRTLHKIEDIVRRKQFRTEMTEGVWYHGKTGVGKSHKAFEDFNPETHYVVPNDGGWWDGYTQQETVIINDFRGEIAYNQLLQMVDKWPYSVKRRGREPMPFTSKKVIITSSLPPAEVYKRRNDEDSLDQLNRRFNIIELY